MRHLLSLVIYLLISSLTAVGQITTTKIAEPVNEPSSSIYDSTENFLGEDVNQYIGQELYLLGDPIMKDFGYDDFYLSYTAEYYFDKSNVYKCCSSTGKSIYDAIVNKYFSVIDVHPDPNQDKTYYLELIRRDNGDKVYFRYSSAFEHSFPFVVAGYFEKQKRKIKDKKFVSRGISWDLNKEIKDINTGNIVSISPGRVWKSIDLTIDERYHSLSILLVNEESDERILLPLSQSTNQDFVFSYVDHLKFENKYGDEDWKIILKGSVKIGFTEEMIRLSWGEPTRINRASYGDQWVYGNQYLYVKNGKLTAFN